MYGYKVPLDKQDDPETILAYWLENAVPNDPQIYSYLVDRYGVQVYRLAFILLDKYQVQDEQDIKEIASRAFSLAAEAIYQASTDLDSFRGATSVSSWLFARTYRISRYRWVRRGLSRNSFTGDEIFIDLAESDATLQLKGEEERLIEALYKLPRHLSLVVLLRECLHLTVEEIAYVLGRRIIKIEKVLSRGRSELRRAQARTDAPAGDIRRIIKKYIDSRLPSLSATGMRAYFQPQMDRRQPKIIELLAGITGKLAELLVVGLVVLLVLTIVWLFTRGDVHQGKPLYPTIPEPTPTAMPYAEVSVRSAPETIEEEINFSYHFEPDLSENGRWLVFSRVDPTENSGIFLFDLLNGDVIRVDRPVDGISSQGGSYNPTISGDGRWIAFSSNLENLYPGEKQDCYWNNQLIACMDVYIYDNQSGALERISQDQHGNGADGNNIYPAISPDGRWIAFWSSAKNLLDDGRESCGTEDQSQDCWDVFIYDREDGEFWRLPVGRAIDFVDVIRIYPLSLSDGGTHLALTIHARDQIANDLGISGTSGVYVFDRQRGEWLSGDWFTEGQNFIGSSFLPTLSSDGRYVAFVSTIDGLVSQDANKAADVFIVNLQDGEIELISLSTLGHSGDDYSGIMPEDTLIWGERLGLSDDGRYVVFLSKAGNLTAQPGVGCRVSQYSYCSEVYIHDRQTGRTIATITQPSGDGFYLFPGISGDGGTVYYVHFHLNCPQAPYCADILFYDRSTARITSPMLDDPEMAVEHPSAWRTLRYLDASDGGGVNGLAFSPDAETLAAGMSDGSIRRWRLPEGKTLAALKMHSRPVTNLAYDPGGYVLASASHDGTVGLWSAMDGALLRRLPGEAGAIFDLAFFPGGEILSVGAVRAAWNWDIRDLTFALWDYFSYSSEQVRAVAISPDGELMAHGLSDGSLWIRRVSTMDVIARLAHLDEINSLDFSPDGGYLASGSKDGLVHLWSITQGSGEYRIRLRTKFQHADWVNDLSFSVDSQWLAVASFGSDIHIWSTQEGGGNDLSLNAGGFQPLSITFSPDGRWLAAGSSWGGVRIWEVPIP